MLFRILLGAGGGTGAELGDWNARLSTITTESGALSHGAVVSAVSDLSTAEVAISAGSGDRPVIDRAKVPSLRLIAFDSDDRLSGAVTATVRTAVILFYLPASPAARTILARDTSATTTKPAFNIGLTA